MATRRRRRGEVLDPKQLGYLVSGSTKDRFDAVANLADIGSSELIELLILRMLDNELTDQGIPSWLPQKDRSEELPINTA
jgi:hypothetical protein